MQMPNTTNGMNKIPVTSAIGVPITERGGGLLFPPETIEQDPNGIDQHSPGSKLDAYKTKPDLVLGGFSRALNAVAQVGTYGAKKYTPSGWRVVPDGIERYSDAMMRHYLAERAGKDGREERDSESSFLHAAHLAWNALARLELILQEMEG